MGFYTKQELEDKNVLLRQAMKKPEEYSGEHLKIKAAIAKNQRRLKVLEEQDKVVTKTKGKPQQLTNEEKRQKRKEYQKQKKEAKKK